VARLVARVLISDFADRADLRFVTLHDTAPPPDLPAPVRPCQGSRVRMAYNALRRSRTHLITDACNLGQLRQLPGLGRKPYLTILHGIEIWEAAKPRWVRSAKAAAVQVFNSEYTRTRAEAIHGPFSRAQVCWLATESDDEPPERSRPGSLDVLIVSRLEEDYKGHRELIAAWPAVVAEVPGATLRVVGRGPGRQALEALAAESGAGRNIVFEGFVSEARLDELYARAAAFAMPSRGEGFGLVYIEAMRHGLPVIASTHDAGREVVLDGETGYTVNLENPGLLANRVVRLLQNADLAARLGAAGRRRWAEHFRFSGFRSRFRPIVDSFLSGAAGAPG
jgi:phosphatidylinositol alpha-1,6-mannosyltransferase